MFNIDTLTITPKLLQTVAEIDEFKGAWRALGTMAPDRLSALKRVATIESIASSTRIEGSQLTDQQVRQLLSNLDVQSFATRDEQEVAGYADVMETVFNAWQDLHPTENHIKQLHRDLLRYSNKDDRHRGEYKTANNHVVAFNAAGNQVGIVFETASPFDTPRLMGELIEWFNECIESNELHPLICIGIFVVVFLEIHPFQDGNGRLSRVITTLLLLRSGYLYVPYSSLESVVEQSKEGYYLALRQTQGTIRTETPDWSPWLSFFIQALSQQMHRLRIKVERERLLVTKLPPAALEILDHLKNHGRITMAEAVALTGANRNTLKGHFKKLVEQGLVETNGKGRGVWYGLR